MNVSVVNKLVQLGWVIGTMESCTGGLIASLLTDIEGSSRVLHGCRVTYSNEEKIRAGVPLKIIDNHGVYSSECAIEMALAMASLPNNNIGLGVTGTLGNVDPNNKDSTPGKVYYSFCIKSPDFPDAFEWMSASIQIDVNLYPFRNSQKQYVSEVILTHLSIFLESYI